LKNLPRALKHDFVFTYKGSSIAEGGIKRSFKTACKNAGVPYGRKTHNGVTFHDIRRSVKTNMLNAGIDKIYRDLILGHSLKGMDIHYLAPSEKSLKDAMNKYTIWLDGQIAEARKMLTKLLTKNKEESAINLLTI
jgi:integrase